MFEDYTTIPALFAGLYARAKREGAMGWNIYGTSATLATVPKEEFRRRFMLRQMDLHVDEEVPPGVFRVRPRNYAVWVELRHD